MEFLFLIAAVAAMLWGTVFVLRGSLFVGLILMLVVGSCFGHQYTHFDVGPITLTLDRIAIVGIAGAYLFQRLTGRLEPRPFTTQDYVLFAFLGILSVSTVYGLAIGEGQEGVPAAWRLIAGYFIPATIYWIARELPSSRDRWTLLLGSLTCFGVYLGLTGIAEHTQQWWAVFPKNIADPTVGLHFGRARGPMLQLPTYGVYLAVCMLAAWLWLPRLNRFGQLAVFCTLPVMMAGIAFSMTRSVWLGAGLGSVIVLVLSLQGSWRKMVIGSVVAATLLVGLTQADNLLKLKRDETAAEAEMSARSRVSFAYVSWQMFLDRPLMGCGFGNFPTAVLPYLDDRSVDLPLHRLRGLSHHNTLLSLLCETGIIGLSAFCTLLFFWARTAWKVFRDSSIPDWGRSQGVLMLGALGVYVAQLLFHDLTYTPMENSLMYLLAGLTLAVQFKQTDRDIFAERWTFVPADQMLPELAPEIEKPAGSV